MRNIIPYKNNMEENQIRKLQRQVVNFTELFKRGTEKDCMKFTMKYYGDLYYFWGVLADNKRDCYCQVLDEDKTIYRTKDRRNTRNI